MDTNTARFLPVLSVRNLVLYPGTSVPLRIGRAKTIAALKAALESDGNLLIVSEKLESPETGSALSELGEPTPERLYKVGTLAKVVKSRGESERGFQAIVRGLSRYRLLDVRDGAYLTARAEETPDVVDVDLRTGQALLENLKTVSRELLELLPADTHQLIELVNGIDDLGYLSHLAAANLELPHAKKQEILETLSLKARVLMLLELMASMKDGLQVQGEIREKLSHKMGKMQREAILREQLKAIREELGEDQAASKDDYRKKIEDAEMPPEVKKTALEELKRLETVGQGSPETHVIRNYLDLLCAMPWSVSSGMKSVSSGMKSVSSTGTDGIDLKTAREILEKDHYGLEKVKKRILQSLAVMALKKDRRGSVMLFVGPPGVGKTSLGQSIAKALGRKFVRGSLGGVRDDAEIRGHRRTYVGAMPGRIIQGIRRAGENNPVFMLDELDKLSHSFQGDPASALLEVLDPAQNSNFLDHYLDVPFDLSKVFFIGTANTLETIPGPLLDRMEVIDLTGYTTAEKLHIAKNHLIPKQLEEHGLTPSQLQISDESLLQIAQAHTREAGVRDLERKIAAVCRARAEEIVKPETVLPIRVLPQDLEEILGAERYIHEVAERIAPPGVVTGLAWTPQGGEILFVEGSLMPGSGRLTLTGQLGDVMKESAQIALSLVRSRLALIVPGFEFDKNDIHIHVPAGAIPKDGPSAGVTMLTTIASIFSNRSVPPKLAMTGEVTLRGAVMPVGGIKEKVIAAHRAGIERVILARRNERDLKEVPEDVRSQLKFEFVENVSEVLKLALGLDIGPMGAEVVSNSRLSNLLTTSRGLDGRA